MHQLNVIHRDLKLGNLFLDRHLSVKIGDLGLATKLAHENERKRTICGTPNYIAPEIIDGKGGHSFQVDVWSIGVIMYTLLVGKPPYEAKDVKSTYKRILANMYSFPDHVQVSDRAKNLIRSMLQSKPELRPTLDEVSNHPFFTHADVRIPASLPQSSTQHEPKWRINSRDEIVIDITQQQQGESDTGRTTRSSSKTHSDAPESKPSASSRRPLSTRSSNTNTAGSSQAATKKETQVSAAAKANANANANAEADKENSKPKEESKGSGKWAFKIYDDYRSSKKDKENTKNTTETSTKTTSDTNGDIAELTARTAALKMTSNTKKIDHKSTLKVENADVDLCALETMHQRLSQSFSKTDILANGKIFDEGRSSAATTWVTRYVDYTSKYGLGFLLNDGSAGVYFNDSTKIVLSPEGEVFQYIERRKMNDTDRRGDHVRETHTLTTYPSSLQKKVILLKHFRNYLVEQHKRSEEKGSDKNSKDVIVTDLESNSNIEPPTTIKPSAKSGVDEDELCYLKKWVRTRHAILFRLSNRTVQVVFFDHTEVLLSSEAKLVTYVDKQRNRSTHSLGAVMKEPRADIAKRLKYTKDILYQLISGSKK